ncbi:MAG: ABC transporter permease subunit [Candidatus Lindowbacteria bacterium]|nr:ABC transporter permease subunit [Candidatus Lindowbacteria bacterium]
MIWWKEWRETRFGFLAALLFVTGLYYSIPAKRQLIDEYWLGVFLAFFGQATAIVMGSSAMASETTADTLIFLVSKPVKRIKCLIAKYLIRGGEVSLIIIAPLTCMVGADWEDHIEWMWVPPYIGPQYLALSLAVVIFIYSEAFFFSIVLKKQALCALASIAFMGGYTVLRGIPVMQAIYYLESVHTEILLLVLVSISMFIASLLLFKMKEF